MQRLLFVGLGGFMGACLRFILCESTQKWGSGLPWGTLLANVIGGMLIGLLMELSLSTDMIPPNLRLLLVTGLLGGFTTFSAFSYETVNLFSAGSYGLAALNIGANLILSLSGVVIGKTVSGIFL